MLNIIGPVNNLSYGIVTKNIVESFSKIGKVSLLPISVDGYCSNTITDAINRTDPRHSFFNEFGKYPSVRIWHAQDMSIFNGYPHIGFPIFELDTFTDLEKRQLDMCDKIFVTSEWGKEVVNNNLKGKDVGVIPLGVNTDVFKPLDTPKSNKIIFLNIGKWEKRKGHYTLANAFKDAFTTEDVELWMSCTNPFYDCSRFEKNYKNVLEDKVKIIPWQNTDKDVAELMNIADVGVFPYSAEGWCLPLIEMLSCGKDVIATNATAPTEYLSEENALLLESNGLEKAEDDIWFNGHGNWHTFKYDDLVDLLRIGYERAKQRRSNGTRNESGISTGRRFSWDSTATAIRGAIG